MIPDNYTKTNTQKLLDREFLLHENFSDNPKKLWKEDSPRCRIELDHNLI